MLLGQPHEGDIVVPVGQKMIAQIAREAQPFAGQ